nr:ARID DNA-binding domain-containing protein [Tanacetum cinerariifolium]
SQRFKPWEKSIREHPQDFKMRYSLTNGTAEIVPNSQRKKLSHKGKTMLNEKMKEIEVFNSTLVCTAAEIVPNSQRKKLSHKGKTMLNEKMKEIEVFNSTLVCTAFKRKDVKTRKEKRARCFIWKERGHALWKCHNKKNKNKGETLKALAEKRPKYPERVLDVEEDERKFIFSYGVGETRIETKVGALIIPNVHYTPEITMNVLSMKQLENQGYIVTYERNRCVIKYMFDEGKGVEDVQEDSMMDCEDSARMIESHNKFLDEYFESIDPKIDPKEECSLIGGMEDLKTEKEDFHYYIDDEYLSMNGTLYAMKVNTFLRFISFLDLIKIDKLVYKN